MKRRKNRKTTAAQDAVKTENMHMAALGEALLARVTAPAKKRPRATIAAIQENHGLHSTVISKRAELRAFELKQVEESILNLTSALAERRNKRKLLLEEMDGIDAVLKSRADVRSDAL